MHYLQSVLERELATEAERFAKTPTIDKLDVIYKVLCSLYYVKELKDEEDSESKAKVYYGGVEPSDTSQETCIKKPDKISDELMGATEYYNRWLETHDEHYKRMAGDELRHADFLIEEAGKTAATPEQKRHLQDMRNWRNLISQKIQ